MYALLYVKQDKHVKREKTDFFAYLMIIERYILLVLHKYRASSRESLSSGSPPMSDTNWAVQPQKMARDLNF